MEPPAEAAHEIHSLLATQYSSVLTRSYDRPTDAKQRDSKQGYSAIGCDP